MVIRIFIQAEKKYESVLQVVIPEAIMNLDVFYFINGTSAFTMERTFAEYLFLVFQGILQRNSFKGKS